MPKLHTPAFTMLIGFAALLAFSPLPLLAQTATTLNAAELSGKSPEETERLLKTEILYRTALGSAEDVKLLLDKGASPKQTNDEGVPALSLAAARRDAEGPAVARLLIERGADINARDKEGQTALFYAVRSGTPDMAKLLLDSNINYYAVDNKGTIARNMAYAMNKTELVQMMDDFVREQSQRVQQQYEDMNRAILDQYKLNADAATAEQLERQKRLREEQDAEEALIKAKQERQKTPEFAQEIENLAFSNCALQYWSYIKATQQKADYSGEALDEAIEDYSNAIVQSSQTLVDDYATYVPYIEMVATKAKQLIFAKIDNMPSKIERFSRGIGKKTDMQERCEEIGKNWQEMQIEPKPAPVDYTAGSGTVGIPPVGAGAPRNPVNIVRPPTRLPQVTPQSR